MVWVIIPLGIGTFVLPLTEQSRTLKSGLLKESSAIDNTVQQTSLTGLTSLQLDGSQAVLSKVHWRCAKKRFTALTNINLNILTAITFELITLDLHRTSLSEMQCP